MNKLLPIILIFALLLCACGGGAVSEKPAPVEEHAILPISAGSVANTIIINSPMALEAVVFVNDSYEPDALAGYVQGYYGLDSGDWSDCAMYRAADATLAYEISIFKLTAEAEPVAVFDNLEAYRLDRQGDFFGYNPEQEAIVADSKVCISNNGLWAAVLICQDADRAESAFNAAVMDKNYNNGAENESPVPIGTVPPTSPNPEYEAGNSNYPEYWRPYVDPEIDDMSIRDSGAVVSALKSGDSSGLEGQYRELYIKTGSVLEEIISPEMSDLEKEKAVYDWLCANCVYDYRHYEVPNSAPRTSYEPYGAIVDGEAVCLGFATAFQLFMDALDIECITVVGAAFDSREDHAWNMIEIDGEWYCADPTWDAGNIPEWYNYFNVSSDHMAMTDHQWEYDKYPLAR